MPGDIGMVPNPTLANYGDLPASPINIRPAQARNTKFRETVTPVLESAEVIGKILSFTPGHRQPVA